MARTIVDRGALWDAFFWPSLGQQAIQVLCTLSDGAVY
jgi:hypothetical protein